VIGYIVNWNVGEIQELRRLLNGYLAFLKKSRRGENQPGSVHRIQEDTIRYTPVSDADNPIP
jgi:ABC-type long-subunit fatty acid transport system fused permease/ATPase subunit